MPELSDELRGLRVEWPETPDLAEPVAARLAAAPARRHARWRPALVPAAARRRARWRPASTVVLATLCAVMVASPSARSAVLAWLGFERARIERREPQAPPPRPGTLGSSLGLGRPVTLAEAQRRAPFLRLPRASGLGEPDATYLGRTSVALVYGRRPGYPRAPETGASLLVQLLPGRVGPFIRKAVGVGGRLTRLRVGDDPAYFIAGAHGFAFSDGTEARFEPERLAGNALLVERHDGLLIRVEGRVMRRQAVAVARSIP